MGNVRPQVAVGIIAALLLALAGIGLLGPSGAQAVGPYTFSDSDCTSGTTSTLVTNIQNAVSNGESISYTGATPCTVELGGVTLTPQDGVPITIDGGVGLTLDGQHLNYIINIEFNSSGSALTLDHLTLENGIDGIRAAYAMGTITVNNSTLSGNNYGIDTDGASGTIIISNSTLSGNRYIGIDISSTSGTITISNSTLSGSKPDIDADYASGTITISDSTLRGTGNGINADDVSGTIIISNSTLSGDAVAIAAEFTSGTITVSNSTLSGNVTGIIADHVSGTFSVSATILAESTNVDCVGTVTDGGYNLSASSDGSDDSCGFASSTNHSQNVTDAQLNLLLLGNYGGLTQTIALGPGSVAIDAIPAGTSATINGQPVTICPTTADGSGTDQRRIARPQGAGCDAGAYEAPALSLAVSPSSPNGSNGWYTTDPTVTLGYSGLAIGQDTSGASQAQVASCAGLSGLSHTATGLNDSGSVPVTITSDGIHQITCGVSQGTTALGVSYGGPTLPLDLKVDTTKPTITLTMPAATTYALDQTVAADYTCTDATSQIAATNGCVGTVADGSPIDTSTLGSHTFTVNAKDNAGNTSSTRVTYTVGYAITTLPGSTTTIQRGYYAVIRFAPEDAQGHDLARRNLTVTSLELDAPNGQVIPFAYPFQYATFSGTAGYQLSINTRNLTPGTWALVIQIGSGKNATTGTLTFTVQ